MKGKAMTCRYGGRTYSHQQLLRLCRALQDDGVRVAMHWLDTGIVVDLFPRHDNADRISHACHETSPFTALAEAVRRMEVY